MPIISSRKSREILTLCCIIPTLLLSACSQQKAETLEFIRVDNFPVPQKAEMRSPEDKFSLTIKEQYDVVWEKYTSYLVKDGWTVRTVDSPKVLHVEKDEQAYLLIITKTNDENATAISIKIYE